MLHRREIGVQQLSALAESGYVFAIVDACVAPKAVMHKAEDLGGARAVSLFHGTELQEYYAVAPYLFSVDQVVLDWILAHLGGLHWGVLALTKATREALIAHLQRFFLALLPDGQKWFFRYYDPVILETYLPSCQIEELQQFFGPIRGFTIIDSEEPKAQIFELPPSASAQVLSVPASHALWPIRAEQLHALSEASTHRFIRQVANHLREQFPEESLRLGQLELETWIRHSMLRAASYGIATERDLCHYVDLTFALGKNFDCDPQHRWAAEILNAPTVHPSEKLRRVYDEAIRRDGLEGV